MQGGGWASKSYRFLQPEEWAYNMGRINKIELYMCAVQQLQQNYCMNYHKLGLFVCKKCDANVIRLGTIILQTCFVN